MEGWTPKTGESLQMLSSSNGDGPWLGDLWRDNWAVANPVTVKRAGLHPGQGGFFRTRLSHNVRGLGFLGESWSPVSEIRTPSQPIPISLTNRESLFFGRRGQKLSVKVEGEWMPFKVEGLKPYGPEGVSGDEFREIVESQKEREGNLTEEESKSNQDNLLGIAMQQPGGTAPPVGGLQNVAYFLEDKGSFPAREIAAGALYATFTPARSGSSLRALGDPIDIITIGQPSVMAMGRNWTFEFPEDGVVRFSVNACGEGWVGAHLFTGSGELKLHAILLGEPVNDPSPPVTRKAPDPGMPGTTNP